MSARRGQVAIYLVLVLVAITFLVMMNVGAFLAVREKNRAMNAGDAAALAVAKYQGELLNYIGQRNLDHLRLLLDCKRIPGEPDEERLARMEACREQCRELHHDQLRTSFLGPIGGISLGNRYAEENGIPQSEAMLDILKQHAIEVRTIYAENPDLYPAPWEGAWEEYAQRIEMEIGKGLWVGPDNIEFLDGVEGHMLKTRQFYNAIAGRNWCWFHFYAKGLLDSYSNFRDWNPLPRPDRDTLARRCVNSEIYSLHLVSRSGSALALFGKEVVMQLMGVTEAEIAESLMIGDGVQSWLCYGGKWESWSANPYLDFYFRPDDFPIVGEIKPEYDVLGCAAICRVASSFPDVVTDQDERYVSWFAAAKPFGTVINVEGAVDKVTELGGLVTPAFSDVRLVPVDSVGGRDLMTADPAWMVHVRDHVEPYLIGGPSACEGNCWFCRQLKDWEQKTLRSTGREWLKANAGSCRRASGPGSERGGTPHGH